MIKTIPLNETIFVPLEQPANISGSTDAKWSTSTISTIPKLPRLHPFTKKKSTRQRKAKVLRYK